MDPDLRSGSPVAPGAGCVLVAGFGAFLEVQDNPAARLARAVHDPQGEPPVVGVEMSVSYARGPAEILALAAQLHPRMVLGLGVARGRTEATLERFACRGLDPSLADVDQVFRSLCDPDPDAPERVQATLPLDRMAAAMGCTLSEDAGRYVCNAWLYTIGRALGSVLPVGFLHLPPQGMSADRLRAGIHAALAPRPAAR